MDVLVIVLAVLSVIGFICFLEGLDSMNTIGVSLSLALIASCAIAAIFIGLFIHKGPYVQAVVSSKQILRCLDGRSTYFGSPAAVFKVHAYKQNCLIPTDLTFVFPDPGIEDLTPEDALFLIRER